jgi:hypothetical protein
MISFGIKKRNYCLISQFRVQLLENRKFQFISSFPAKKLLTST